MSTGDDMTESTPRAGSGADVARRLDRMETRQDSMEAALNSLQGIVSRVEQNQKHADEIAVLRHDAMKGALDQLTNTVGTFIGRIEGIIDGSIQTTQTRQGAEVMADYLSWRKKVDSQLPAPDEVANYRAWRKELDDRLDVLEEDESARRQRVAGRGDILSWGKIAVITVAPIVTVLIALLTFLGAGK